MNDNDISLEQLKYWMELPMTKEFQKRIVELFDHQSNLMSTPLGTPVDVYIGRANVLQYVMDPSALFDDE